MLEHLQADDEWPTWDEALLVADTVEIVVQINGKLRARLSVASADAGDEAKITALALADPNIQKFVSAAPKKTIFVPRNRLLNFVI